MAAIGTEIAAIAESIGAMIVSLFQSLAGIFYTAGTGDTAGTLTFFGYLAIFASIVGLVIWLVNWVRSMIRVR